MSDFVPPTEYVRAAYQMTDQRYVEWTCSGDNFDRWLRKVMADTWDLGYLRGARDAELDMEPADNPYREET